MRLQITEKIIKPKLGTIVVTMVVAYLMVFVPRLCDVDVDRGSVAFDIATEAAPLWHMNYWWSLVIQAALVTGVMVYSIEMCAKMQIVPGRSSMPFVIGMMIYACEDSVQMFDSGTVAFVALVVAIRQLMMMHEREGLYRRAFDIGGLMAVALIFNKVYFILTPIFIVGFVVFRVASWRVISSFVCGIMVVVFIVMASYFVFGDRILSFEDIYRGAVETRGYSWWSWEESKRSAVGLLFLLMSACAFVEYFAASSNQKINTRLNYTFICISLILGIVWIMGLRLFESGEVAVPGLFVTLILSLYYTTNTGKMANVSFVVLIIGCIAYRIFDSIGGIWTV